MPAGGSAPEKVLRKNLNENERYVSIDELIKGRAKKENLSMETVPSHSRSTLGFFTQSPPASLPSACAVVVMRCAVREKIQQ